MSTIDQAGRARWFGGSHKPARRFESSPATRIAIASLACLVIAAVAAWPTRR